MWIQTHKLTAGNNGVITQQMFHQPGCSGGLFLFKITRPYHLWNDDIDDGDDDDKDHLWNDNDDDGDDSDNDDKDHRRDDNDAGDNLHNHDDYDYNGNGDDNDDDDRAR